MMKIFDSLHCRFKPEVKIMKYTVRLADMPLNIRSFVELENDYYTIVINSRLSHDAQIECYLHEVRHITAGDFRMEETADKIEMSSHKNRPVWGRAVCEKELV